MVLNASVQIGGQRGIRAKSMNEDDQPLAGDKLGEIRVWAEDMQRTLDNEDISLSELSEIDLVHDIIKGTFYSK